MIYSFNTILLSAQKTGSPNLIETSLSASGVNTQTLSTFDEGIVFNARTTLNNVLSTMTVQGSTFRIDTSYHGTLMALVKRPSNNIETYTVFLHTSAATTPAAALSSNVVNVTTPDTRRKWVLGYI